MPEDLVGEREMESEDSIEVFVQVGRGEAGGRDSRDAEGGARDRDNKL